MSDDARDETGSGSHDFGEDDGATPPVDPAFDAWLATAAPSLNVPGEVPADQMWEGIVASRAASVAASDGRVAGVRPLRRARWIRPLSIAAALLLGVALDRLVVSRTARRDALPVARRAAVEEASVAGDSNVRAGLYRLAAVQTLSQAEALLTAYRAGGDAGVADPAVRQLGAWAREVLGSTRLLIDSPAGADPHLRPLLNDIELVLVQIVRLSGAPLDSSDRALIERAMRDRDLLPRIRTAVPAGSAGVGIASDD